MENPTPSRSGSAHNVGQAQAIYGCQSNTSFASFRKTNKIRIMSKNQGCGQSTSLAQGGSLANPVVTSNLTSNLNVVCFALNGHC